MTRTLLIALALAAAAASPAAAADVRIALSGKSDAAIRAEIATAARKVCTDASADSSFAAYLVSSCYRATVRKAEATLATRTTRTEAGRLLAAQ